MVGPDLDITEEIVAAARAAAVVGAPAGKVIHPESALDALREIGGRREAGERIRAEAMLDLAAWAPAARRAGLNVSEIARAAGVTRPTVYAMLEEG